jgi:chemotaxis protein methyltransferase CheR
MSQPAFQRDDYIDFCEGVRRLTGIDLAQYKRPQMERRIRSFADRKGMPALPAYLAALTADRKALDEFLDRMTINVSQLWRNPEQWTRLQQAILPELARAGSITAWSAGCSYGAEAYTLAAVCREVAPGCRVVFRLWVL